MTTSNAVRDFGWLLTRFAEDTSGVISSIAVSADGILLASSAGLDRALAEQFAAVVSGMTSLTQGTSRMLSFGDVNQIIIEMNGGYVFTTAISLGSALGVIAEKSCDLGLIAYEMALLAQRAGSVLTPQLLDEMKNSFLPA
ncbi:MAG: roadblock/LC7 domain-containing protein [Angustibacter sp.]